MKTVLVADDEFDLADTLRAILETEGYRAQTCSNGREVLEHLKAERPDLLLMDVMMPLLSGYEVLRQMRQAPGLDAVPVVLMSSVPARGQPEQGEWRAFLRKPFSLEVLLSTVAQVIGKPGDEPR